MADQYRRLLDKLTGKGGVNCYCCNWTTTKQDRKLLHQMARSILKREIPKLIDSTGSSEPKEV